MLKILFGIFLILHGLVHLLYFGQSRRLFELQSGMVWPDESWVFSKLVGERTTRLLAGIACIIAAAVFVAGGIGVLVGQAWWYPVVMGSTIYSSAIIIIFWDGKLQRLDDQGFVGLLINLAVLVVSLVLF